MKSIIHLRNSLLGVSSVGVFLIQQTDCDDSTKKTNNDIVMTLSPKSSEFLKNHLSKLGMSNFEGKQVIIKKSATFDDVYLYEPMMGERVVFRLKGVIKSESGNTGFGRMSCLTGEINHEDFLTSLPLIDTTKQTTNHAQNLSILAHLPTRLMRAKLLPEKAHWKGRLSSYYLKEPTQETHPAIRCEYSVFPWKSQIVLEGNLCATQYIDKDGVCMFDRSVLSSEAETVAVESRKSDREASPAETESDTRVASSSEGGGGGETETDSETECPVCKYMKGGPCKEAFLSWDMCISNLSSKEDLKTCYQQTIEMMSCMRCHDYYDSFTALTDENSYNSVLSETDKE